MVDMTVTCWTLSAGLAGAMLASVKSARATDGLPNADKCAAINHSNPHSFWGSPKHKATTAPLYGRIVKIHLRLRGGRTPHAPVRRVEYWLFFSLFTLSKEILTWKSCVEFFIKKIPTFRIRNIVMAD